MKESSRRELQSLLRSFEAEADPIADKLEKNHREIFRLRELVNTLSNDFSEDEYVFSPRSDKTHMEEIRKSKAELQRLEQEEADLQRKYEQINTNIDSLVSILATEDGGTANITGLNYQEQDRLRIARDLHDTSLQNMAYVVNKLESCTRYIDEDPIKAKMELSIALRNLKESIDGIRSIIYNLRPMIIDSVGLKSALYRLIEKLNENQEYQIVSDIDDVSCDNQMILISIYRIVEECFQNIKLHAEAFRIHFILQEQLGHYYIYVEDDGKGFDPDSIQVNDQFHFGLTIMKERVKLLGGNMNIITQINGGTKIKILIPS